MPFSKKDVVSAINYVIEQIDQNPFIINTEIDIHAMLYMKLCQIHDKLYPIDFKQRGISIKDKNNNEYKTKLVHCEYLFGKIKSGKRTKKRFDLVIFDEKDTKSINSHRLTKGTDKNYDAIQLKHVVEIKLEVGGGGSKNREFKGSLVEKDIEKLIEFKENQEKKYNNSPNLYFVYVVKWPVRKKTIRVDIKKLEKDLKRKCKNKIEIKSSINFLTDL